MLGEGSHLLHKVSKGENTQGPMNHAQGHWLEATAPRADEQRNFLDSVSCGFGFGYHPPQSCQYLGPPQRISKQTLPVYFPLKEARWPRFVYKNSSAEIVKFQAVKNTVTYWAATIS